MNNLLSDDRHAGSSDPPQGLATPGVTDEEQLQLLINWNATQADYPSARCLHELFEDQVERTPDSVAVVFQGQQLTYRQLNRRANALAHHLSALGAGPDVLVGICVEPSLEMMLGLLGILKAGSAYVPLDPAYPRELLDFMLEDSQVSIVLTQSSLEARLSPGRLKHLIALDHAWATAGAERDAGPASGVQASHLAYIIYTSGSTGKPKGVQVLQRGVVNLLWSMRTQPGLSERDVLFAVTTLSFDIACLELFLPLIVGAKVRIASRETKRDGAKLIAALGEGVTILQGTPATWRLLLNSGWSGTPGLKMLCGGEAMSRELARELRARGAFLWNLYGPTETTIYSTAQNIEADEAKISIGRPISNTRIYIVDPEMQPVPIGAVGELLIGGDGVARGYLNQPELTAAKFRDDPFLPGSRVFRTGDCGFFLPDGRIILLGRMDQQVKIRGYRIELGEIEATLASHPSVRTAVVTAHDNGQGSKILIAYFVLKADPAPAVVELRRHLHKSLPDHMVPSVFVPLTQLPLTPSGKIDRKALPIPDLTKRARPRAASGDEPERNALLPRDTVELRLAHIWQKAIGIRVVDIRDDFFDLGGDSLMAARILAEIEADFGTQLSLTKLLKAPTIEGLAQALHTSEPSIPGSPLVLLKAGHKKPPLFFIHHVGGHLMGFRDLVNCLQLEQSIYGVQSIGLDGTQAPLATIEEMARNYVNEVRGVQPVGPFFFIGCSFGGLVAYEMAQNLRSRGETVELVLLDTNGPKFYKPSLPRFAEHLGYFRGLGLREKGKYLRERVHKLKARFTTMMWRLRHKNALVHGKDVPATLENIEMTNLLAEQRYRPQVYAGPATLFRAQDQVVGTFNDPKLGWGDLITGDLEVYDVPGDHITMMREPHVRLIAEPLQALVRRSLEK